MGILMDISLVALLIILITVGIKKGFFGSTIKVISSLLTMGGGALIGALFIINGSKIILINSLYNSLPALLADLIFFVIGFIIGCIFFGITIKIVVKFLGRFTDWIGFRIIDSTLGVIAYVGIVFGVFLVILAFIHSFEGSLLMVSLRDFIKSTYLIKFLYNNVAGSFSGAFSSVADIFIKVYLG